MAKFKQLEGDAVGLVMLGKDGGDVQIGLSQEQSDMLQMFAAMLSQHSPLAKLGEDYNLYFKK